MGTVDACEQNSVLLQQWLQAAAAAAAAAAARGREQIMAHTAFNCC
jgi:hypothetical protein